MPIWCLWSTLAYLCLLGLPRASNRYCGNPPCLPTRVRACGVYGVWGVYMCMYRIDPLLRNPLRVCAGRFSVLLPVAACCCVALCCGFLLLLATRVAVCGAILFILLLVCLLVFSGIYCSVGLLSVYWLGMRFCMFSVYWGGMGLLVLFCSLWFPVLLRHAATWCSLSPVSPCPCVASGTLVSVYWLVSGYCASIVCLGISLSGICGYLVLLYG